MAKTIMLNHVIKTSLVFVFLYQIIFECTSEII